MLASNRGTLMELGITPIISSGMVFQVCDHNLIGLLRRDKDHIRLTIVSPLSSLPVPTSSMSTLT